MFRINVKSFLRHKTFTTTLTKRRSRTASLSAEQAAPRGLVILASPPCLIFQGDSYLIEPAEAKKKKMFLMI